MAECEVCGVGTPAGEKRCFPCRSHFLADELLSDPGFEQIRSALAKALEWLYWLGNTCQLHNLVDGDKIILAHDDFVKEKMQPKAVEALCYSDLRLRTPQCVADPWSAVALRPVRSAIGMSLEGTRAYVEELRARGVVQIERCDAGRPMPGAKPFSTLFRWVECDPGEPTE
jgi:hypothetical protein